MSSFYVISLLIISVFGVYGAHLLVRKLIDPRKNGWMLISFFLLHFLMIIILSFLVNWLVLEQVK